MKQSYRKKNAILGWLALLRVIFVLLSIFESQKQYKLDHNRLIFLNIYLSIYVFICNDKANQKRKVALSLVSVNNLLFLEVEKIKNTSTTDF